MPSDVVIDGALCVNRLQKLYSWWHDEANDKHNGNEDSNNEQNSLKQADAIIIARGSKEEDFTYSKTAAMQTWLFGYEIYDIIVVLCQDSVIFFSTAKKINYLKQIERDRTSTENGPQSFIFLVRKEDDEKNLEDIMNRIKRSRHGQNLGIFSKDKMEGNLGEKWQSCLEKHDFTTIDISVALGHLLATKDDKELALIRRACEITGKLYSKQLKDQIVNIVASERKIRHSRISDSLEAALNEERFIPKLDINNVEMCYPPIVQSGGKYNLKFSAANDKNLLHYGGSSIVCAFGVRYKSYCSNIVRTLLVNPSKDMESHYGFLLECEEIIINTLQHNVPLCDVYRAVRGKVERDRPDLVNKMTPNLGTALGIEFRENSLAITNKCTSKAQKGMTFQISIGFTELTNPEGKDQLSKVYALFIGDTVLVNEGAPCAVYTTTKKDLSHVAIILKEDDAEEEEEEVETASNVASGRRNPVVEKRPAAAPDDARQEFQRNLLRKLNENARVRLVSKNDKTSTAKARKKFNSYKSEGQLPQDPAIDSLRIYVDVRYGTVILPINGSPTPFHISTIKSASLANEGEHFYLRINFDHPTGRGKQVEPMDKEHVYIKELNYRESKQKNDNGASSNHLEQACKLIIETQKKFREAEQERKQIEDVVRQDALILNNSKTNPKLKDLYIRPSLANKKISGTLEAHINGFRYTSMRGDKIDILYSNVKHAFYQPCDSEMIILIHFHLENAIVFGKKKRLEVQFFTEVGELTTDLGKNRNTHDKDDIIAEQAERELRNKLKSSFQSFIDRVCQQKNVNIEFEQPIRGLGFHGTPYRSMVLIVPTTTCLVQLTEWPPLVIVLDEIELVHFERVHFQLKNFDMVFIMKDYSKKTQAIQAIPLAELDPIRKWLNSCEICYTEGTQTLNWAKIMKTITDDLPGFFENGGWSFLGSDSDDVAENPDGEDSDEEEEDYNPEEDDSGEEGSESEYSGEEEEEEEEDLEEASGSGSSEDLGSDEESGKSWSELEEEARKADEEKFENNSDSEGRNKKKVKKSAPPSNKFKKRSNRSPSPPPNKKKKR